jgi:peptidoglycan/LPS O-acetylase OafA/YrhL
MLVDITALSTTDRIAHKSLTRPLMPELDSLRGVAILLVLFLHGFAYVVDPASFTGLAGQFMAATSYGWIGVQLFFVLSGFLITGILLDSRTRPDYYRRFYIRRALRILPAYYAVLFILALLTQTSWLGHHKVGVPFILLSVIYLSNVTPLFGIPVQYTVLWSLAVEEHFYLIWPTIVRRLSRRSLGFVAMGIFLASPIVRAVSMHFGSLGATNFYSWCNADGLALGALISIALRGTLRRSLLWYLSVLAATGSAATLALGARIGVLTSVSTSGFALRLSILNLGFAALLIITVLVGTSSKKSLVNVRLLQFFGQISYGLYLVHMLCFYAYDQLAGRFRVSLIPSNGHCGSVVLRFVCAGSVSIAVATLSRRYFEEHFLRLKDKLAEQSGSRDGIPGPGTNQVELSIQDTVVVGGNVICDRVSC